MLRVNTNVNDVIAGGYTIPKGTLVNFLLIRTHNDERYFPNPTQFKPERFENSIKHPYSFLPFSAGLRNCIGKIEKIIANKRKKRKKKH